MGIIKIKDKTIAEQIASMKNKYPHFNTNFTSLGKMKTTGILQPTARSDNYKFILTYNLNDSPKMKIIFPALLKNSKEENIPHIYPGENLCLYHPKYREFDKTDFLCDTIIPWTSLWLYYYEVWHLTGEWHGGGEHPVNMKI